jgi:hypothetical protein
VKSIIISILLVILALIIIPALNTNVNNVPILTAINVLESEGDWVLAGGLHTVPGDLNPRIDVSYDLGSSTAKWKTAFVQTLNAPTGREAYILAASDSPAPYKAEANVTVSGDADDEIATAIASGYSRIVGAPGHYTICFANPLTFNVAGMTFEGMDRDSTIFTVKNASTALHYFYATAANVKFKNFTVNGNYLNIAAIPGEKNQDGIYFDTTSTNGLAENLYVYDTLGMGIFTYGNYCNIINNVVTNTNDSQIQFNSDYNTISNNHCNGGANSTIGGGIEGEVYGNSTGDNNVFWHTVQGLRLSNSSYNTFSNTIIDTVTALPVYIGGDSNYNTITNTTVKGQGAIYIVDAPAPAGNPALTVHNSLIGGTIYDANEIHLEGGSHNKVAYFDSYSASVNAVYLKNTQYDEIVGIHAINTGSSTAFKADTGTLYCTFKDNVSTGNILEVANADYNFYENNNVTTITLVGIHSRIKDNQNTVHISEMRPAIADLLNIMGDARGLWMMNEQGATTTIVDQVADTHNMTASANLSTWATQPAVICRLPYFVYDGTNNWTSAVDADVFSFGTGIAETGFSIIAAVNFSNWTAGDQIIFGKCGAWGGNEYKLKVGSTGKVGAYTHDVSAAATRARYYNTALSLNTWYVIVAVYDGGGAAGTWKIYIDKVRVDDTDDNGGVYVAMENGTDPVGNFRTDAGPTKAAFLLGSEGVVGVTAKQLSAADVVIVTDVIYGLMGK